MKNVITYLKALGSRVAGSQRNDVEFDRRLTVGSPSGFTINWTLKLVSVLVLVLTIGSGNAWGADSNATFTISGKSGSSSPYTITGSLSGAPTGATASCQSTYNDKNQLTSGKTQTLTLSGFDGCTITGVKVHVKTNASSGGGSGTLTINESSKGSLSATGVIGSSYTDKSFSVASTVVGTGKTVVITLTASANSFYCDKYTVTYTPKPARTVSFSTGTGNPEVESRAEASGGAGITLPSTSDLTPTCSSDGWYLFGWTTAAYGSSSTTTAPTSTLVGYPGAKYYPEANTTLYAVYAKVTGAGTAQTLTGTYASHSGWTISDGICTNGYWILCTGHSITSPVMSDLSTITSIVISTRTYGGTSYKTTVVKTDGGTSVGSVNATGTSWTNQTISSLSLSGSGSLVFTSSTTTAAYGPGINSITINFTATPKIYWHSPTCETCDDPTALGKGSFNSSTHVQQITWTSEAGKVDICYSTSSTKPDDSPSSDYTVISGQTGSTSTSNTYNLDVSSLAPGNYYVWARSVCSASASSDWKAMASPGYFTLPGHTLTIAKTGGGTSTTTPAIGNHSVTEGNSVSITASPASGYSFTSWSVSGTGSTLSSTSSNPTTFTMGTANSTVTATFSQIYVTSLKLRAQQTDQSDKTGSDLTMTCYPKEGQTGGNDPLNHTLNVAFNEVLPSTALDKTYDWSVRVKAKGDADWTAVSFTDNALNTNTIINSYNKSTGNLQIKSTEGTAEIKITAHDGSGVTAKVTITVSNVAMSSVSVDPTEMTVYAGQKKAVAVTFTPANATDRSYSAGSSYSFVNIQNKAAASFNIEGKTSVTAETKNETVTVTTTDGGKTATVAVTIKPLPLVHFVDIIHNETFADVVATTDGTTVTFAKTVPTHDDLDAPVSGNDCEKEHLHLIGWIRSDYSKVSAYMEGTGEAPTNAEITGAGAGYYYAAGAAITLSDALHGKTFYAVWAKTE